MDANNYQALAARTLLSNPDRSLEGKEMMLVWNALGLLGEAGEIAEHVKKGVFHRNGLEQSKIIEELGDVLWYAAAICSVMGIDLAEVMEQNIEKLRYRYPEGYVPGGGKR